MYSDEMLLSESIKEMDEILLNYRQLTGEIQENLEFVIILNDLYRVFINDPKNLNHWKENLPENLRNYILSRPKDEK